MEQKKQSVLGRFLITDRSFYIRALAIVIPVMLQSLINTGVNMMDTIMVGKLGEVAISASSLANQFYSIFHLLCMGLSAAGLVLSAQYWGAGDREEVNRVFDLLVQLILIAGALFGLASYFLAERIMGLYTDDRDVILAGATYLRVTALIYLPHGVSLVISVVVRSVGNAKLGLYISMISFAVNIGCNYVFIFGELGFPAMGVKGAALGTLCARVVELAVCLVYMLRFDRALCYRFDGVLRLPRKDMVQEFIRLGLPAIVSDTLLALAMSAISMILGHMGREIVSAYAIVSVVDRMCLVANSGMSSAAGVLVGQAVGEGDFKRAKREGWSFLILSVCIGVVGGILVLTAGNWSVRFYDIAPHTVDITRTMMRASALMALFGAAQAVLSKGVLRGGGDTRFLLVADVLFQWVASIPLGYLAGLVWGWPPFWVLIALRIDYIIKSFWLLFRLSGDKWIHRAQNIKGA